LVAASPATTRSFFAATAVRLRLRSDLGEVREARGASAAALVVVFFFSFCCCFLSAAAVRGIFVLKCFFRRIMRVLSVDVGRRNMACAIVDGSTLAVTHAKQGAVANDSCAAVVDFFADLPAHDAVVMERQPGPNVRMCRLQHYVEMMYYMRGVPLTVFDPRKRLEFAFGSRWWPAKTPFPKTYYTRKQAAVGTCREFLAATGQTVTAFDAAAKKDDLADAVVQALAFLAAAAAPSSSRSGPVGAGDGGGGPVRAAL
jgi:Poxvirus A22 protein